MINCPICQQSLPDGAKFCFKCRNQIICKECNKEILPNATICVYCGSPVIQNIASENNAVNKVEFHEDANGRNFTATFTDATASNIVDVLSPFIPPSRKKQIEYHGHDSIIQDTEVIEATTTVETVEINTSENVLSESKKLDKIFQLSGDDLCLHESRLNANSKVDFAGRLTLLYLLYKYVQGIKEVAISEVNDFLKQEGFTQDGNYRAWKSKNKSYFSTRNNKYIIGRAGLDQARIYLEEAIDETKVGNWQKGKNTNSKTSSVNNGAVKKNGIKSYILIKELDLSPKNKESLKDFISKHTPANGQMYNLCFVYYLQTVLELQGITPNHIYTCYKNLNVKFPSNIYQSIADTSKRKGWINTSNMNDITITTLGENALIIE